MLQASTTHKSMSELLFPLSFHHADRTLERSNRGVRHMPFFLFQAYSNSYSLCKTEGHEIFSWMEDPPQGLVEFCPQIHSRVFHCKTASRKLPIYGGFHFNIFPRWAQTLILYTSDPCLMTCSPTTEVTIALNKWYLGLVLKVLATAASPWS